MGIYRNKYTKNTSVNRNLDAKKACSGAVKLKEKYIKKESSYSSEY
jgi:hypothetical protein